jgi:hypothetical protein
MRGHLETGDNGRSHAEVITPPSAGVARGREQSPMRWVAKVEPF